MATDFVKISLLPLGPDPLSGPEEVPAVQAGVTYRFPSRAFMLPTVDPVITPMDFTSQLPMSRFLAAGVGITIVDGGPGSAITISAPAGGGQVNTVVAGSGIDVDATDPANPIVAIEPALLGADMVTFTNETAVFANSRRLVAGTNVAFDLTTPSVLTLNVSGGTPGGSDTQIQYNDGGVFNGDSGLTFNDVANTVTITASAVPLVLTDGAIVGNFEFAFSRLVYGTTSTHTVGIKTNNINRIQVDENGHVSISTPSNSSAQALVVSTNAGAVGVSVASAAGTAAMADLQSFRTNSTIDTALAGANLNLWNIAGVVGQTTLQQSGGQTEIWQADSGLTQRQVLRVGVSDRATYTRVNDGATLLEVGQRGLNLISSESGSFTLDANDNGMVIQYTGSGGHTATGYAASNGVGITLANVGTGNLTIAPGSGTLTWINSGSLTVGNHTLPAGTTAYINRQGGNWYGWTVSAGAAGGGAVATVTATADAGITVDNTDPANPKVGINPVVFDFAFTGAAIDAITYGNSTDFPSHTFWGSVELDPLAGTAFIIYGVDAQNSIYVESASTTDSVPDIQVTRASTGTAANTGASIQLRNSGSNRASVLQQIATGFEIHAYNGSVWTRGVLVGIDGAVTIGPPPSGMPMTVTTVAATGAAIQVEDLTSTADPIISTYRQSSGAGVGIGRLNFNGRDSASNVQLYSAVQGEMTTTTSGAEQGKLNFRTTVAGADVVRATLDGDIFSIYNNGGLLPAAAVDSGTYTGSYSGFTTTPTNDIKWVRVGRMVILSIPIVSATSNSTTTSENGGNMPTSIRPSTNLACPEVQCVNSGAVARAQPIVQSTGDIIFGFNGTGGWTNSGTKGIGNVSGRVQVVYYIDG
jgi:hypothetical protein